MVFERLGAHRFADHEALVIGHLQPLVEIDRGGFRALPLTVFLPLVETLGTLIAYSPKYAHAAADRRGDVPQALIDQLSRLGCKEKAEGDDAPRMRRAQIRCGTRSMFVLLPDSPIDELRDGFVHRDAPVRELAAELLARRTGEAAAAAPALAACLRSRHEDARFADSFVDAIHANAAEALLAIEAEDNVAIPAHAWAVQHAAEPQRYRSTAFLARNGAGAAEAVPALVVALEDASPRVVREAITALGAIGPTARSAVVALQKKVASSDRQVAERARAALRAIGDE